MAQTTVTLFEVVPTDTPAELLENHNSDSISAIGVGSDGQTTYVEVNVASMVVDEQIVADGSTTLVTETFAPYTFTG